MYPIEPAIFGKQCIINLTPQIVNCSRNIKILLLLAKSLEIPKTKTLSFVLQALPDQDLGLDDYIYSTSLPKFTVVQLPAVLTP